MLVGQDVIEEGTRKLLLKNGTRLTDSIINRLLSYEIDTIEVNDPDTLLLYPDDIIRTLLTECYKSASKKIIPNSITASMTDKAYKSGKVVKELIPCIIDDEQLREACVNMQIINYRILLQVGVYTSVYSMMIASIMELEKSQILDIGKAGVLHDVGLCEMPYLITSEELPPGQRPLYHEHPTYAYYMLKEQHYSEEVATIIYGHHERYDGKGYPRQLKGEEIPIGSRIVGLCSDYDNFINLNGMEPYEAVEHMYGNSNICYDKKVVDTFVRNIPIYPMGATVELTTGEVGIVVNIRKNKGPRPVVRIFYNRVKKEISHPYFMDLGKEKTIFIKKIINI